jgi:hypothetical protein
MGSGVANDETRASSLVRDRRLHWRNVWGSSLKLTGK